MSKKVFTLIAVLVMAAMILSACGAPATQSPTPAETQPPAAEATEPPAEATEPPAEATKPPAEVTEPPAGETIRACQVTDAGGIDDRSFNATAWLGVQRAMEELGIDGQYLESQQQTDYERNISQFIEADCDLIITVGFLLDAATAAAADANPDQNFAIVDFAYDPPRDNVLGLVYATHQAGFLAGYLAAGMTQTGAIGTFGGLQIPSVTTFMDGYALGAQYYNEVHGTDVRVLGWDPVAQTGLFAGNFESTDDGRTLGTTLMDEGADVIMPVAGPVGLGTAAAVQERGEGYYIVGVDSDWTVSSPEYADIILTSVIKRMDNSVYDAIQQVIDGTFAGGIYLGTLENEGVGLGTIHANVPAELIAEVEALIPEIIAGNIQTDPTAQ